MDDLSDFEAAVSAALSGVGCSSYSIVDLKRDARECRDQIYADSLSHGEDTGAPFVNFVITDDVAVYTVFTDPFAVYITRCSEQALITATRELSMSDVDAHLALIQSLGKSNPDASISRSASELWLG